MKTMGMIGVEKLQQPGKDARNQVEMELTGVLIYSSFIVALTCFENLSLAMVHGVDLCIFVTSSPVAWVNEKKQNRGLFLCISSKIPCFV